MTEKSTLNPWYYKLWWCQPWSILLTGCGAIAGSWLLFHNYWLTGFVTIPMGTWMIFFVIFWPKLMQESGLLSQYQSQTEDAIKTK